MATLLYDGLVERSRDMLRPCTVLGLLAQGGGGEHGARLRSRDHFREIRHTPEVPLEKDLEQMERWRSTLAELLAAERLAEKSWYRPGTADIPVVTEDARSLAIPLSQLSAVVRNIGGIRQVRLFVRRED